MDTSAEVAKWQEIVKAERERLQRLDPQGTRLSRSDLERYERKLAEITGKVLSWHAD